jgi:Na+-driven multidrug efflux pump
MSFRGQNGQVSDETLDEDIPIRPLEGLEGGPVDDGSVNDGAARTGLLQGKLSSIRAEMQVPLYRNAYLMMLNTALTSVLGFVYWFIAGNVYSAEQFGYSFALIQAMVLMSNIAQLNGAQILMRYVPVAGKGTRRLITWTFLLPSAASLLVSVIALSGAHLLLSDNNTLHMGLGLSVWFVLSVVTWSLFNLQDAAFIGLRRVFWVPVDNTSFGIVKIALLFPFFGIFAGTGIFISWTLPVLLSLFPLQWLLYRRFIPKHEAEATGDEPPIERDAVVRFVAWDYFGWMFAQAAGTIVPLLVVSVLGKEANAYFSMPQIIATAVDLFVTNLMTSLVVEASRDMEAVAHFSRLILKRVVMIVFPAVALVIIAAPLFFAVLPGGYGEQGTTVLRLLALATVPRVVIALSNSLSRLDQKTHQVTIVQAVQAALIIGLSMWLMKDHGINGAAFAVLAAPTIIALALLPRLIVRLSPRMAARSAAKNQN